MVTVGRRVYGLGAIVLGLVELRYGAFAEVWLPVPAHTPGYAVLVDAASVLLILGGLAINWRRTAVVAALSLASLFAVGMLLAEAPRVVVRPANWGGWQAVAESTVMALGGALAWLQTSAADEQSRSRLSRVIFGLCLLIFGVSHFVYAKFTASMVPAWIPPSQMAWAYATGLAQLAAGLAVLTGLWARRAAILLTVMYAAFGVLVHLPAVIANPSSHDVWAENAINLVLTGAAWVLAERLGKTREVEQSA
jgi:uncharacterized membrane protein